VAPLRVGKRGLGKGVKRKGFVRGGRMSGVSGSGDGAKRLGGKLLEEVEVEDLTSVCVMATQHHTPHRHLKA
jgi:hypothetical protein